MRVLFVLPAPVRIPMGGAAVVYRHAEGLARRGRKVTIATPRRGEGLGGRLIAGAVSVRNWVHGVSGRSEYTAVGVETVEPSSWRELGARRFDAVIATGYQTAEWANSLSDKGRGFYFLQHDERHLTEAAEQTWHLPLVRIAVASWIAETVGAAGAPVAGVVPNAVDTDRFRSFVDPADRAPRVIALYHRLPSKGPDILIDTLQGLRSDMQEVEADVIAARPPQHRFPSWVRVHVRPDAYQLVDLYNHAAVCLHTSRLEGWGLVPMEAAACGCAVVATESKGVNEYLVPDRSMLQVPVDDIAGLVAACRRVLADDALRLRLSEAAVEDVSRFSWEASTDQLERLLLDHLGAA